eukprot:UC4_evm10s135
MMLQQTKERRAHKSHGVAATHKEEEKAEEEEKQRVAEIRAGVPDVPSLDSFFPSTGAETPETDSEDPLQPEGVIPSSPLDVSADSKIQGESKDLIRDDSQTTQKHNSKVMAHSIEELSKRKTDNTSNLSCIPTSQESDSEQQIHNIGPGSSSFERSADFSRQGAKQVVEIKTKPLQSSIYPSFEPNHARERSPSVPSAPPEPFSHLTSVSKDPHEAAFNNDFCTTTLRLFSSERLLEYAGDCLQAVPGSALCDAFTSTFLSKSSKAINEVSARVNVPAEVPHPLNLLLIEYRKARRAQKSIASDLDAASTCTNEAVSSSWQIEELEARLEYKVPDSPGKRSSVCVLSRKHEVATFVAKKPNLSSCMERERKLRHVHLVAATFDTRNARSAIRAYIERVVFDCPDAAALLPNAPVARIASQSISNHDLKSAARCGGSESCLMLRSCIDVLFAHLHEEHVESDSVFLTDCRKWLHNLLGTLSRLATPFDHWFVLEHILRGRCGITQHFGRHVIFPVGDERSVNYALAMLGALLRPVGPGFGPGGVGECDDNLYNEYENDMENSGHEVNDLGSHNREYSTSNTSDWQILEEDGTVRNLMCLDEDDYLYLLQRVPIAEILHPSNPSDDFFSSIMHAIIVARTIIGFVGSCLSRLGSRFKSLRSAVADLTIQAVRSVSFSCGDFWTSDTFKKDKRFLTFGYRLQLELDDTIWRAAQSVFWDLPFHILSLEGARKIFTTFQTMSKSAFKQDEIDISDATRIIGALANLACSRINNRKRDLASLTGTTSSAITLPGELLFIEEVLVDLLEFSEFLPRISRDAITSITSCIPLTISFVLQHKFKSFKLALYIFKSISLIYWQPNQGDLKIIGEWMRKKPSSPQNELARFVIAGLNWGFLSQESKMKHSCESNKLAIDANIHCEVAVLIVEWCGKCNPHSLDHSQHKRLSDWGWKILFSLQLFILSVVDLETTPLLSPIRKALQIACPMALYFATIVTQSGHTGSAFVASGLSRMISLCEQGIPEAALAVFHNVLPRLINRASDIQKIISHPNYLKIFEIIFSQKPIEGFIASKISRIFERVQGGQDLMNSSIGKYISNIIICDIGNTDNRPNFMNSRVMNNNGKLKYAELWMRGLLSVNRWYLNQDIRCALDSTFSIIFWIDGGIAISETLLSEEIKKFNDKYRSSRGYLAINTKLANMAAKITGMPTFPASLSMGLEDNSVTVLEELAKDPNSTYSLDYPYLTFRLLYAESTREYMLWNQCGHMISASGNISASVAAKRCGNVSAEEYTIFHWALGASSIPITHPLWALFWEMFFSLYFSKIGATGERSFIFGYKFLEPYPNILSYLIQRLQYDIASQGETQVEIMLDKINIAKSFRLWLTNKELLSEGAYLPSLPPSMCIFRLRHIMDVDIFREGPSGVRLWWMDIATGKTEDDSTHREPWLCNSFVTPLQTFFFEPPGACLKPYNDNKESDETNFTLPTYDPAINTEDLINNKEYFSQQFESEINLIEDNAHQHATSLALHVALDEELIELIPQLYVNEVQIVEEAGHSLEYLQMRSVVGVKKNIQRIRFEQEQLVHSSVLSKSVDFACEKIQKACNELNILVQQHSQKGKDFECKHLIHFASNLFFKLVSALSKDSCRNHPALGPFLSQVVSHLGQKYISHDREQIWPLVRTLFRNPALDQYLTKYFCPSLDHSQFKDLLEFVWEGRGNRREEGGRKKERRRGFTTTQAKPPKKLRTYRHASTIWVY